MGMGDKMTIPAGYSGTPLSKKLGIKPGFHIKLVNEPEYYFSLFTDLPADLDFKMIQTQKTTLCIFLLKRKMNLLRPCHY
jgi:hypothetical protein